MCDFSKSVLNKRDKALLHLPKYDLVNCSNIAIFFLRIKYWVRGLVINISFRIWNVWFNLRSCIHQHQWSAFYEPGTILGGGVTMLKNEKFLLFWSLHSGWTGTNTKYLMINTMVKIKLGDEQLECKDPGQPKRYG